MFGEMLNWENKVVEVVEWDTSEHRAALFLGDCFDVFPVIPSESIDMILCDLPYGQLNRKNPAAQWDKKLPLDELWAQYKRIIKPNGAIVLFGQGMYTAELMMSNSKMWRYNLVWKKGNRVSGFLNANRAPLRNHEDILVFYKRQPAYNPQMVVGKKNHSKGNGPHKGKQSCYGDFKEVKSSETNLKYPTSILDFEKEHPQSFHPPQKPVALLEWLIKTYTNGGEIVLDNCMGSGSTGVACMKTGRYFIGIENNPEYFEIALQRIHEANSEWPKED